MQYLLYYFYDSIILFFESPGWQRTFFYIKLSSAVISFLLVFGIVIFILKTELLTIGLRRLIRGTEAPTFPKGKIRKQWDKILARVEAKDEANLKLAVIEADGLVDFLLKRIGYKGETMFERLKSIKPAQLKSLDGLWQAHKVRNRVVHEPNFKINLNQTEEVIENFKKVLEELEAI